MRLDRAPGSLSVPAAVMLAAAAHVLARLTMTLTSQRRAAGHSRIDLRGSHGRATRHRRTCGRATR